MAADYATLGGVDIDGWELRRLTDEPRPDPASPGLNIPQIIEALDDLHVWAADRSGRTWPYLMAALQLQQGILLQGDRDQFGDKPCANSFRGDHMVLVTAKDSTGRLLVFDPLCKGPSWTSAADVRRYAEKLGRATGLTGGGIRYAVTRAVPLIAG